MAAHAATRFSLLLLEPGEIYFDDFSAALYRCVQRYSTSLSQGFEDEDLWNSLGWWAATVATHCPSRPSQRLATAVTRHCGIMDEKCCIFESEFVFPLKGFLPFYSNVLPILKRNPEENKRPQNVKPSPNAASGRSRRKAEEDEDDLDAPVEGREAIQ